MLYMTTRSTKTTYTAQTVMRETAAPDGGLFLPLAMPQFAPNAVMELAGLPFWDCVAQILRCWFPVPVDGSVLRRYCGDGPEVIPIRYKTGLAQAWSRRTGTADGLREDLAACLGLRPGPEESWLTVGMEIAILFGLYGQLCRAGVTAPGRSVYLAMDSGEFALPAASQYAAQMGLPLADLICVAPRGNCLWELLHRGTARLAELPRNMERLLVLELSAEKMACCRESGGERLTLTEEARASLCRRFYAAVADDNRADAQIGQMLRSGVCRMSRNTAMIYCGLMDFRALRQTGAPAMLLAGCSPMRQGGEAPPQGEQESARQKGG